ncbi:DUF2247 family protein [Terrabacter carboxydivorans]|uniref:DUF2247 family protein n=1 Tax=Terrabacter carboxydivorans TaxID=619730 RepID=A0ABN3LNW3_9MICO
MSVDFIARHVDLLPPELAWGYRSGYVDGRDVVRLAELTVSSGHSDSPALQELSLLLRDAVGRVPDLVDQLDDAPGGAVLTPSRVWLFLVLSLAWEQRQDSADAFAELEQIYADFDYPEEMEGFVPFLPAPAGSEPGRAALEMRWSAYLADRRQEFAHRSRPPEV